MTMVNVSPDAMTIREELRAFLNTIIDEGTHIDSGGGFGQADLWPKIGGKEFLVSIKDLGTYQVKAGE